MRFIYLSLSDYKFLYSAAFIVIISMSGCSEMGVNKEPDLKVLTNTQIEELLDRVQRETFNYFWEGGEPFSGAARERIHLDGEYPDNDQDVVTSGGTGFGIMATLAGIERGVITRDEGYLRLKHLTEWLGDTERYHGAWSHWMFPDGSTKPFSQYDDGGDIVETAFLVQGLIAARQYFIDGNEEEQTLAQQMDSLWISVEWDWYTRDEDILYWHWSPNHGWKMNFRIRGYNECLIAYILAVASPTYPVAPSVYHKGFMRSGDIVTDREYYGLPTVLDHFDASDLPVGPLFWAHYSYMGLDPRNLSDQYADYWELNRNHTLINYRHCVANPNNYKQYSENCWGLTSSYSINFYAGHNPEEDVGVIAPTAALSSFPYTPAESLKFLNFLYENKDTLIGKYGPYDAFSYHHDWFPHRYLAIDQLPIPVMIENHRSGLIWELFMSAPEIQSALNKLGFNY